MVCSQSMSKDEIREAALKYAVHNASTHEGVAQKGPIIARIMGESPELRTQAKTVIAIVEEVLEEVNSWTLERQTQMIQDRWPELLETKRKEEEKKTLPPLENVERFEEIRTRFAPNPDGALHLGSAEPIIFCDEYAKMYDGRFVLRYEDTSPDVKAPILEVYDWIMEDIKWLEVKVDEVYMQSDRLEIYYGYAVKLMEMGAAYVCTCDSTVFKELYMAKKACPCRDQPPEVHLERWGKMLDGTYKKGEAVVRIKTDLEHPNPAIRDWPALRIVTGTHPRQGNKYRVWPLYNYSCGIDDHEMVISHIIRELMIQIGPKPINAMLSWDHVASVNRRIIEPKAKRFYFVKDPVALHVTGIDGNHIAKLMRHPDHLDWGTRDYEVTPDEGEASFVISGEDLDRLDLGGKARLMGLFNIEVTGKTQSGVDARYLSKGRQEAREADAPFIHWLPKGVGMNAKVVMPDASEAKGLAEPSCADLKPDDMIQFERFGFVRVESASPFVAFYTHR